MARRRKRNRRYSYKPKYPHILVKDFRTKLWIQQKYRCGICKKQIRRRHLYTDRVNIDHIRPRSHGGSSYPENLQLTHFECNARKGSNCDGCDWCNQG